MLIFQWCFNVVGPPQGLPVEHSEVASELNSGVGFNNIDF